MITKALANASIKAVVLTILQQEDSYGYQIIQRMTNLSEGDIQLTTGTLYPFLHGLANEGLVESYWQAVENAPRRKYYKLTDKGEKALLREKEQWLNVNRLLVKLWGPSTELAWS